MLFASCFVCLFSCICKYRAIENGCNKGTRITVATGLNYLE